MTVPRATGLFESFETTLSRDRNKCIVMNGLTPPYERGSMEKGGVGGVTENEADNPEVGLSTESHGDVLGSHPTARRV
jgi:hypothetical protein